MIGKRKRLAIPPRGFIGSELFERTFAGPARIVDSLTGVVGAHDRGGPVPGELARALARLIPTLLLQSFRHALVKARAAGRSDVVVERVLYEHVCEREPSGPLGALLQQRCRNRLVEQVEQPPLGQIEHGEQEVEVEVAADRRGGAQGRVSVVVEPLDPAPDDLADAPRQAQLGDLPRHLPASAVLLHDRTGLPQLTRELDGEERVARRLARDLPRQLGPVLAEGLPRQRFHQRQHIAGLEARERDALTDPVAVEVGQESGERMISREVGVAVGAHDHHSLRAAGRRGEVAQQRQGGHVRPLQVIENQQQRLLLGCPLQ